MNLLHTTQRCVYKIFVAYAQRCVYKIFVAYAQRCLIRCVYNKSVGLYTRVCI